MLPRRRLLSCELVSSEMSPQRDADSSRSAGGSAIARALALEPYREIAPWFTALAAGTWTGAATLPSSSAAATTAAGSPPAASVRTCSQMRSASAPTVRRIVAAMLDPDGGLPASTLRRGSRPGWNWPRLITRTTPNPAADGEPLHGAGLHPVSRR